VDVFFETRCTIRIVFVAVAALQNKVIPLGVRCPQIWGFCSHMTQTKQEKVVYRPLSSLRGAQSSEWKFRARHLPFTKLSSDYQRCRDACLAAKGWRLLSRESREMSLSMVTPRRPCTVRRTDAWIVQLAQRTELHVVEGRNFPRRFAAFETRFAVMFFPTHSTFIAHF